MELDLAADAPLCPFKTAELISVPVITLASFSGKLPVETSYLSKRGEKIGFSALTACVGSERIIIYNDYLPFTRSHADIMHEISHLLLMHPPHRLQAETGGRHYDNELEEEANWLGPALLVSEEAALSVVQSGTPIVNAAQTFAVSPSLMKMRLNVTGAERRVRRAA